MASRIVTLFTLFFLPACASVGQAWSEDVPAFKPYLSQGLQRPNTLDPTPDTQHEFVTPRFAKPDRRDQIIVNPDINKRRQLKLKPADGDVRLRTQKGEFPVLSPPIGSSSRDHD